MTLIALGKPKILCDTLYCDICFIAVIWTEPLAFWGMPAC